MSVMRSGCRAFIESATVVSDGETDDAIVHFSGDADVFGIAMTDGVDGELADDLDDVVSGAFRKAISRNIEANLRVDLLQMGGEGVRYGFRQIVFLESAGPEVPKTASEFVTAGGQHLTCRRKKVRRADGVGSPRGQRGVKL